MNVKHTSSGSTLDAIIKSYFATATISEISKESPSSKQPGPVRRSRSLFQSNRAC